MGGGAPAKGPRRQVCFLLGSMWSLVCPVFYGWSPFSSFISPFLVTMPVHIGPQPLELAEVGPDIGGLETNRVVVPSTAARLSGRTWHACV